MISFDDYDNEDEEYLEDSLEDLIEYVLEYIDPDFILKDFVHDRLSNLEGNYQRSDGAVTYYERTDLDKSKFKFCYNIIIKVKLPPEDFEGFDEDEQLMAKTLMLDIYRNSELISEAKPPLNNEYISSENIQIGGIEVFWIGHPRIKVKPIDKLRNG